MLVNHVSFAGVENNANKKQNVQQQKPLASSNLTPKKTVVKQEDNFTRNVAIGAAGTLIAGVALAKTHDSKFLADSVGDGFITSAGNTIKGGLRSIGKTLADGGNSVKKFFGFGKEEAAKAGENAAKPAEGSNAALELKVAEYEANTSGEILANAEALTAKQGDKTVLETKLEKALADQNTLISGKADVKAYSDAKVKVAGAKEKVAAEEAKFGTETNKTTLEEANKSIEEAGTDADKIKALTPEVRALKDAKDGLKTAEDELKNTNILKDIESAKADVEAKKTAAEAAKDDAKTAADAELKTANETLKAKEDALKAADADIEAKEAIEAQLKLVKADSQKTKDAAGNEVASKFEQTVADLKSESEAANKKLADLRKPAEKPEKAEGEAEKPAEKTEGENK